MTIQEFEIEAANANLYIESQISDWIAYIDSLSPDVLIGMKNPYREYSYGYYGTLSTELQHASKMYARKTDRDYSRIVIKCDPTKCNMTLDEAKKYFNDSYIDQIILFRYRNNTIKFEYNIDDVNADIADRRARTYEYAAKKHMYVARDDVKNFEIFANACTYANIDCNKITTTIKQIYDIDVHGSQDMYAILHAISISDMMSIIDDCTMVANV